MAPRHDPPPVPPALIYPVGRHERRHGPSGYADDDNYKPWLRDEFDYRCVYCLCRETWLPDGGRSFSVEHLDPRSVSPGGPTAYERLAYACCQCNSHRGAGALAIDPQDGLGPHLGVLADGTIRGLTLFGTAIIITCGLDRPELTRFRRVMIDLLRHLEGDSGDAAALRRQFLAYPDDLPDLSLLRPPGGNTRPEGVEQSAFACRQRGVLPATY